MRSGSAGIALILPMAVEVPAYGEPAWLDPGFEPLGVTVPDRVAFPSPLP